MKNTMKKQTISFMLIFAILCSVLAPLLSDGGSVNAAGRYYIRVNKATNVVTVYKTKKNGVYSDPVKAFVCSVGNATPIGTFKTPNKYRWWELDGPSFGQYCTRITGSILFHSVWYYTNGKKDSISVKQYNKLGTTASHGCVRLTVADAKWIYDNCPLGTEVNVFWGTSKNDPLGKPKAVKLNAKKFTDWCPTDPDPANPYKNKKPSIQGAKSFTIQVGTKVDWRKGITAKDSLGNSITSDIKYKGNVNRNKEGTYQVTYSVTDALKRTAKKTIKVKVVDKYGPIISGAKNQTVEVDSKPLNLLSGVTAKTRGGVNVTKSLVVSGKVDYSKAGAYKITYTATGTNGLKTKKTVTITVVDKRTPTIEGTKNFKVEVGSTPVDLISHVTAKAPNGEDLTEKITVEGTVDFNKIGDYKITYTVIWDVNNSKATKTITVRVVDSRPVLMTGVEDRTIHYSDSATSDEKKRALVEEKALDGVTPYFYGVEQPKSAVSIKVIYVSSTQYKVEYTLNDGAGNSIILEALFTLKLQ